MSFQPTEYQQRRDWAMKLIIRSRLVEEIIGMCPHLHVQIHKIDVIVPSAQAQCTVRHRPGTHFDVVVKSPKDANGNHTNVWKAFLIRYKNDDVPHFWKYDSGSVTHASQEEALSYMLEELQKFGLRGMDAQKNGLIDGEQEVGEDTYEKEGGAEQGEQS